MRMLSYIVHIFEGLIHSLLFCKNCYFHLALYIGCFLGRLWSKMFRAGDGLTIVLTTIILKIGLYFLPLERQKACQLPCPKATLKLGSKVKVGFLVLVPQ